MSRILVTGAAGFIGSNLCRSLIDSGYFVVGIDNLSAGTLENVHPKVDFRKVGITEPGLTRHFEGIHAVFHLAAKNCLADCAANPVETSLVNVAGTSAVARACVEQGISHLIYADTSAEYEGILDFPSRIDRVHPLSIYACSKRGGWLAADALSRLHGFTLSTVRYFNVYGPAQDWRRMIPPVMSAFTMKLLSGQAPIIYGTGKKARDFVHVDDINRFHLQLVEDFSVQGGIYNLGSGQAYSILEIFEKIEGLLKTGLRPLHQAELPGEADLTLADLSETLRTGWSPRVSLEKGLADFIDYIRSVLKASEPCETSMSSQPFRNNPVTLPPTDT